MQKVIIKGKHKTTWGDVISVNATDIIHVGETVIGDDGIEYTVKRLILPTKPGTDEIGIVYRELANWHYDY